MRLTASFALAVVVAAPALAGGPATPVSEAPVAAAPAPAAPVLDWSGFYAGIQLGHGAFSASTGIPDADGAIYGVHAGYGWDLGTWVLGGELDYDAGEALFVSGEELDYVARLKLRAGFKAGRALVYVTAGPARAKFTDGGVSLSDGGWFAGAGLGYALNDRLVLGGEVLTHQFDAFEGLPVNIDATTATVRASFRF